MVTFAFDLIFPYLMKPTWNLKNQCRRIKLVLSDLDNVFDLDTGSFMGKIIIFQQKFICNYCDCMAHAEIR